MTKINNELEYEATSLRIEELLKTVDNSTSTIDKNLIERKGSKKSGGYYLKSL